MQLAGELSKVNLASLIKLIRNGELSGKVCLTQGVKTAYIFFNSGCLIHAESDNDSGKNALLELFLWSNGTFSYMECEIEKVPITISPDESIEKIIKEGINYQESKKYLDQLRISTRTIFKSVSAETDSPMTRLMDGETTLAEIVNQLGLSKNQYIPILKQLIETGQALVIEKEISNENPIEIPDWVISRLKQDNPDIAQAIVDLVIWTDRIKCWLYQTDADLERLISTIDNQSPKSNNPTGSGANENNVDFAKSQATNLISGELPE